MNPRKAVSDQPLSQFVLHGGDKRYPMANKIEAIPLIDAMNELAH